MNSKNKKYWKIAAVTLCAAILAFTIPMFTSGFFADNYEPVRIVLDPGHGGADTGAVNIYTGLRESDVNLDIALACRDELMRYEGVEVYMTHTGVPAGETLSLADRVDYVNEVGADILISLHCNDADNPEANGAEVYVPLSTYSDTYNQDCTQLAIYMLKQFKSLGLNIRGVKIRQSETGDRIYSHADGTQEVGDYYYVIASTIQQYAIPGMLVEHAFITGDANILGSPTGRHSLGVADATAIAQFYGLRLSDETQPLPYDEPDEAILLTDREIISASDVMNSLIKLPETLTASHVDRLQGIRRDYEKLSDMAKKLVDADQVERLYSSLTRLDREMHPIRLINSEDAGVSVNRIDHTVTGLDYATASLSGTNVSALKGSFSIFVDTAYDTAGIDPSQCRIVITDKEYNTLDIGAQVGTGTLVLLCSGENIIDQLYAVIPGDVSGDGCIDSLDQMLLTEYLDRMASGEAEVESEPELEVWKPGYAELIAADVNNDGRVNRLDVEQLIYMIASNNS